MKKFAYIALATAALAMGACAEQGNGWSVSGKIDNAKGRIALEGYNAGLWYVVDSLEIASDGSFSYKADAPAAYPDVMRVTLDGQSIYFPIDSIDNITIAATAEQFAMNYSLSGSQQAATIQSVDSLLNATVAVKGIDAVIADKDFKKQLFAVAFNDPSIVPIYYLILKSVDGKQLFDISNPSDRRYFGALAQRFAITRPDDPRTSFFEAVFKRAIADASDIVTEIVVPETSLIDIVRYDDNGAKQTLSEIASQGNVVVLSFTSYDLEGSPAYNVLLNEVWDKYHAAGLEIYQLAFDLDEAMWRMRASNLPWTTVWNATTDGTDVLVKYNAQALPMTYIINRKGELATRVIDPNTLLEVVKKYM